MSKVPPPSRPTPAPSAAADRADQDDRELVRDQPPAVDHEPNTFTAARPRDTRALNPEFVRELLQLYRSGSLYVDHKDSEAVRELEAHFNIR